MAGRIWIPPYKPLGVSTRAVPGGGYLAIDAIAGQFGPSPMLQFACRPPRAPAVIDAYREAQAHEMATMADDDQRQMLQDLSERKLTSFSTQVERHSAAERLRWYDQAGERCIVQTAGGLSR